MRFLLLIITFFSISTFADQTIRWKCSPQHPIADAGFFITLSDPSQFPFAQVSEMTIAGSKIIYNDYLYKVESDNITQQEFRDLYSNGRKLKLIINTAEESNKTYPGILNLENRSLGDLGLLKCQKY